MKWGVTCPHPVITWKKSGGKLITLLRILGDKLSTFLVVVIFKGVLDSCLYKYVNIMTKDN